MGHKTPFKAYPLQSGATAVGNGTELQITTPTINMGVAVLQIEGINGDTITFEATLDGSTWYAVRGINLNTGAVATTATADGLWEFPVAGLLKLRARISTYGSGTITVVAMASPYSPDYTAIRAEFPAPA